MSQKCECECECESEYEYGYEYEKRWMKSEKRAKLCSSYETITNTVIIAH